MGIDPNLKKKAAELIREAFDIASEMQHVDLAALNEARPANLRYGSRSDLVRDFWDRADGMLQFARKLELISSEEGEAIRFEVLSRHPDLGEC